jgi:hypothetical protein
MSAAPRPPFLPQSLEEFVIHVSDHQSLWYEYCQQAYEYIDQTTSDVSEQLQQSELKNQSLQQEVEHLRLQLFNNNAVMQYQKDQLKEIKARIVRSIESW